MSLGCPPVSSPCHLLLSLCLQVVNVTGNQDICYYNFLCAHPLGNLRSGQRAWGRAVGGGGQRRGGPGVLRGCPASRSAFNNILSNLGYVLLGLLFLLIILQREINYNRALMRNDTHALVGDTRPRGSAPGGVSASLSTPSPPLYPLQECGIPKHFGLFYAMGTALMMEGLLSACYHVCPNYTNFQFGECRPGTAPGAAPTQPR